MENLYQLGKEGSNLRTVQLRAIAMLAEVDRICRLHNLRYWIDYGTLLGYKRHNGGFIPWDDDLDIDMPSEDYRKFIEIAKTELDPKYFLQTQESDPTSEVGSGNLRIRDNNSLYVFNFQDFRKPCHKGIFIDIFEFVEQPKMAYKPWRYIMRRCSFAYNFFYYNPQLNFHNIVCYFWYPIQYCIFKAIWKLLPKSKERLSPTPETYGNGKPYDTNYLYPLQEIEFEGLKVFAPKDIHKRLTDIYGDYMKLPNEKQRRQHVQYAATNLDDVKCF